jgi:hypothetical protein
MDNKPDNNKDNEQDNKPDNNKDNNDLEKNVSNISILNIEELVDLEKKEEGKNNDFNPSKNVCRKFAKYVNDNFNLKALKYTTYYKEIHHTFIFLIAFVGLFNNNILHLCAILLIVSLDAISIVLLHECPLTTMEKKYLNSTSCEIRNEYLRNLDIMYNCDHDYEKQIELLINVWMLIAGKIIVILFLKTFNLKLNNFNNIYMT